MHIRHPYLLYFCVILQTSVFTYVRSSPFKFIFVVIRLKKSNRTAPLVGRKSTTNKSLYYSTIYILKTKIQK